MSEYTSNPWRPNYGGTIDDTVIGDTTPDAGYFTTLQGKYQSVSTKIDIYNITSADFGRSLRMNSATDKLFNLPSVGVSEDGARITLEKIGAGKVTIAAADLDKIVDSGAGDTIYNNIAAETYATITLEYIHEIVTWVIVNGFGTWTTTD